MRSRRGLAALAVLLLALLLFFNRGRIHFDWGSFLAQLRFVAWGHIAAGIALIYSTYWLRSLRWAIFLRPVKCVSATWLLAPQFIGFTAVALFGRLADVLRPALVARRVELPLASQLAVYTLERTFDLGAAAAIFSGALLFLPRNQPHHEVFLRTGLVSLVGTIFLACVALALRHFGDAIAGLAQRTLHRFSAPAAEAAAQRIRAFRAGLNAIGSAYDLAAVALLSLAMWGLIGMAYTETLHAFPATPQLGALPFSRAMLLMGASIGASAIQIPVLGWFTQIAATAAAMHAFYAAPLEAATACGALLLFVTFLSIVPTGLVCARISGVRLRPAAELRPSAEETAG